MEGILNTLINFLTKSQKIEFIAGSNQLWKHLQKNM
jgi:hypothetical protein